jgi:hypothetical protein
LIHLNKGIKKKIHVSINIPTPNDTKIKREKQLFFIFVLLRDIMIIKDYGKKYEIKQRNAKLIKNSVLIRMKDILFCLKPETSFF